ncbi:MAG: Mth938-like domain-containing protein [Arenicellales bacterium]|jgi:uncharacterized protein
MELETEAIDGRSTISSYASDGVVVGGKTLTESFILTPFADPVPWGVDQFSDLSALLLDKLCGMDCEVLLVGTGMNQVFPSPELSRVLATHGQSAEFMNSRAACSTFNVLSLDDRRVTAAIILPL